MENSHLKPSSFMGSGQIPYKFSAIYPPPKRNPAIFKDLNLQICSLNIGYFNLDCGDKGRAVSPLVGQTLLSVLWICGANTPARPSEE
jgi:hypothetical protein